MFTQLIANLIVFLPLVFGQPRMEIVDPVVFEDNSFVVIAGYTQYSGCLPQIDDTSACGEATPGITLFEDGSIIWQYNDIEIAGCVIEWMGCTAAYTSAHGYTYTATQAATH